MNPDPSPQIDSALESVKQFASDSARQVTAAVKDAEHAVRIKAESTLLETEEYVRRNPLSTVLGALAIGGLLGYAIAASHREELSFRARLAQSPLDTLREAVADAMAPYSKQLREGYGSARSTAADALEHLQEGTERQRHSLGKSLHRFGNNLRFW